MEIDYPLDSEPATPQYVFDVMRSLYGEAPFPFESMANGVLEFSTPIGDWLDAWILDDATFGSWKLGLVNYLNQWWGVAIPFDEWQPLLSASRKHTIGDLRTFRDLARCLVGDDFQRAATVRERGRQGS